MIKNKKKILILYSSFTGNTEKVAYGIYEGFREGGLNPEIKKLNSIENINLKAYDFVCIGSPVIWRLPTESIILSIRNIPRPQEKIIPDGSKKAIVFCTYAGIHLGPKESEAALKMLEIEIEHLGFKVIDRLSIPGKYGNNPNTIKWYHGDMTDRPNQKDIEKCKNFGYTLAKKIKK
ncbi:MAG: flavodoxin family protein [Candidatus Firestonebacteria bacterium]